MRHGARLVAVVAAGILVAAVSPALPAGAARPVSGAADAAADAAAGGAAAAADTLGVDFAQKTGAFRGGATGTLYGFGDDGAPTQALIDGAHITNTSQKAPYGT